MPLVTPPWVGGPDLDDNDRLGMNRCYLLRWAPFDGPLPPIVPSFAGGVRNNLASPNPQVTALRYSRVAVVWPTRDVRSLADYPTRRDFYDSIQKPSKSRFHNE